MSLPFRDITDWIACQRIGPHDRIILPFVLARVGIPPIEMIEETHPTQRYTTKPYWLEYFAPPYGLKKKFYPEAIAKVVDSQPSQAPPTQTLATWQHLPIIPLPYCLHTYRAVAERLPNGQLAIARPYGLWFWTILPAQPQPSR